MYYVHITLLAPVDRTHHVYRYVSEVEYAYRVCSSVSVSTTVLEYVLRTVLVVVTVYSSVYQYTRIPGVYIVRGSIGCMQDSSGTRSTCGAVEHATGTSTRSRTQCTNSHSSMAYTHYVLEYVPCDWDAKMHNLEYIRRVYVLGPSNTRSVSSIYPPILVHVHYGHRPVLECVRDLSAWYTYSKRSYWYSGFHMMYSILYVSVHMYVLE